MSKKWKRMNLVLIDDDCHFLDFNRSELQSLVRVVTLICKDRHEETILEGLKCLRVLSFLWLIFIDYLQ